MSDSARMPFVVEQSPAHQQCEELLSRLRARRKRLAQQLDDMPGLSAEKVALSNEHNAVDAEIRQVRSALIPHRMQHLDKTRKAFREPRRDAAKRALAALREAERAIVEGNAMCAELRRLGGTHADLDLKVLLYLRLPLEKLARNNGEAK